MGNFPDLPRSFSRRDVLTAEALNKILAHARALEAEVTANAVKPGAGVHVSRTATGTTVSALPKAQIFLGGAGSASGDGDGDDYEEPFHVSLTAADLSDDGSSYETTVRMNGGMWYGNGLGDVPVLTPTEFGSAPGDSWRIPSGTVGRTLGGGSASVGTYFLIFLLSTGAAPDTGITTAPAAFYFESDSFDAIRELIQSARDYAFSTFKVVGCWRYASDGTALSLEATPGQVLRSHVWHTNANVLTRGAFGIARIDGTRNGLRISAGYALLRQHAAAWSPRFGEALGIRTETTAGSEWTLNRGVLTTVSLTETTATVVTAVTTEWSALTVQFRGTHDDDWKTAQDVVTGEYYALEEKIFVVLSSKAEYTPLIEVTDSSGGTLNVYADEGQGAPWVCVPSCIAGGADGVQLPVRELYVPPPIGYAGLTTETLVLPTCWVTDTVSARVCAPATIETTTATLTFVSGMKDSVTEVLQLSQAVTAPDETTADDEDVNGDFDGETAGAFLLGELYCDLAPGAVTGVDTGDIFYLPCNAAETGADRLFAVPAQDVYIGDDVFSTDGAAGVVIFLTVEKTAGSATFSYDVPSKMSGDADGQAVGDVPQKLTLHVRGQTAEYTETDGQFSSRFLALKTWFDEDSASTWTVQVPIAVLTADTNTALPIVTPCVSGVVTVCPPLFIALNATVETPEFDCRTKTSETTDTIEFPGEIDEESRETLEDAEDEEDALKSVTASAFEHVETVAGGGYMSGAIAAGATETGAGVDAAAAAGNVIFVSRAIMAALREARRAALRLRSEAEVEAMDTGALPSAWHLEDADFAAARNFDGRARGGGEGLTAVAA